jgi:hypothetical protein
MSIAEAVSGAVGAVAGVFTAKTRRKQAMEEGKNKIHQAQVDGNNTLDLTDAQWEAVSVQANEESWKDEYVTVTITAWIWVALFGALFNRATLDGVKIFLDFCTTNGVDIGWLTSAVVTAAIGLKVWRGR